MHKTLPADPARCARLRSPWPAGLFGAALLAAGAEAQETPPLQEIVVTAERLEAPLQTTPVSVGVVDADTIERRAVVQLSDLVGLVAGVSVPNGFSNMPQAIGIRGVGVSIPAMSQAVGIYIDDAPLIRGYATALWDLPDVVRFEILRGPQGTLYGQNSTGGAAKIQSLDPQATSVAWLSGTLGTHRAVEARAYATGAVGGGLMASVAFSTRHNNGFGYNASLDKQVNQLDVSQARVKLRRASDDTDIVLAIDGLIDRSDINATNYPRNHPDSRPRVTYTTLDTGHFERRAGGIALRVKHRWSPRVTLRSITSLRGFHDDPVDSDWGGLEVQRFWFAQQVKQTSLSQELQWQYRDAGLSMTSGIMAVGDRFDFHRNTTTFPLAAPAPSYTEAQTHQQTSDFGIYAQGRQALTAATSATLGLRLYSTRQKAHNQFWTTDEVQQRTATVYDADGLRTSKAGWLPRLGLDHRWSDDHFLYASISQGAKFAGFNRAANSLLSAQQAARPEKVTTYEAGSKSRLAGGQVNANVAVFYNDYRDYLASLTNTVVNGVRVTDAVLINAGRARTYGVDLEANARLSREFEAALSVEWLRSRFTEFANPTGSAQTDYVGNELPFAPKLSLGATLVWRQALTSGATLSADLSVQYIAAQFSDVTNAAATSLPRQDYVHLGVHHLAAGARWSWSLRVRNLQDRAYALLPLVTPALGVDSTYYNAPRTVLFTLRHDW
ncbi:TonB-dependent receptor [Rubrivivax sp. RP6-9]|uniref:TonB-dependent receptor n=1 Tax=Rubrivivax sp. RP6-9 TaxID=3415750 RepID=UPI003CC561DC